MPAGRVRAFERDDIPQVAALRRRLFTTTVHQSAAASEAYFDLVFFSNPWRDPDLPSWVYTDAAGRITGFLGVIARPMRFRGARIRMAVSTQFMGEPGPAAGLLLARYLDGPQDLCFADAANDTARRIHEGLGGAVAVVHSLYWIFPLRPVRYALSNLGDSLALRAARFVTRPLVRAADAAVRTASKNAHRLKPPAKLETSALDPRDIVELLPAMTTDVSLVPEYTEAGVKWVLDRVEERSRAGSVCGRAVRTADGAPLGWYIYERRGIRGEIVQIAARPGKWADVLRMLLADAHSDGMGAVAGRLDPRHAQEVADLPCAFTRNGFWSLTHARNPELARAVLSGDTFLSRLDAEWWVNF